MPENTSSRDNPAASTSRSSAAAAPERSLVRREPGIVTLIVGLAVMAMTLLLPNEHRPIAAYPALALIAVGVLLILRHGPDPQRLKQRKD